ncbi:MAG: flagellar hook-length control protein FliK [Syntrophobacterales bacterium]|nr:flagellar hook-length control protein FliK [Syntrophobacterales bacterium]
MFQIKPRILEKLETMQDARISSALTRRRTNEQERDFLPFFIDQTKKSDVEIGSQKLLNNSKKAKDRNGSKESQPLTLQDVVNEMGLSYFFIVTQKGDTSKQNELIDKNSLTMDLKEASQLLSELGFSAEDIMSLQMQASEDGKISLQALINFLYSSTSEGATIKGSELSKILSTISLDSNQLHFSLDGEKTFSLEEVKSIFSGIYKLTEEAKLDLTDSALNKPLELVLSSEVSSYQGVGKENQVYQRELGDAFAKAVISSSSDRAGDEGYFSDSNAILSSTNQPVNQKEDGLVSTTSGFVDPSFPKNLEEDIDNGASFKSGNLDSMATHSSSETSTSAEVNTSHRFFGDSGKGFSENFSFNPGQQDTPNGGLNGLFRDPSLGNFDQLFGQMQEKFSLTSNVISQSSILSEVNEYNISYVRYEGRNSLIIQLEPEELGKVVVKLTAKDQKVSATITTETDEARILLQKNSEILKQYLEGQGLLLEEFSVETGNGGNNTYSKRQNYEGIFLPDEGITTNFSSGLVTSRGSNNSGNVTSIEGHLIYFYA